MTWAGARASPARLRLPCARHLSPQSRRSAPCTRTEPAPCRLLVNTFVFILPPIPGFTGSSGGSMRITPPMAPAPYCTLAAPLSTSMRAGENGSISGAWSPPHCWPSCVTPALSISTRALWTPRSTGFETAGPVVSADTPGRDSSVSPSVWPRLSSRADGGRTRTDWLEPVSSPARSRSPVTTTSSPTRVSGSILTSSAVGRCSETMTSVFIVL